jgi:hypothetical protein
VVVVVIVEMAKIAQIAPRTRWMSGRIVDFTLARAAEGQPYKHARSWNDPNKNGLRNLLPPLENGALPKPTSDRRVTEKQKYPETSEPNCHRTHGVRPFNDTAIQPRKRDRPKGGSPCGCLRVTANGNRVP